MTKTGNLLRVSATEPPPIIGGTAFSYDILITNDVPDARQALRNHLHSLRQIRANQSQIDVALIIAAELVNNATNAKRILRGRNPAELGGLLLSPARLEVGVLDEVAAFGKGFIIDDDRKFAVSGLVLAVTDQLPADLSTQIDLSPLTDLQLMTQQGKGLYEIGKFTHNLASYRQKESSKIVSTVVPCEPFTPEYC